jgi:hypothetical protein
MNLIALQSIDELIFITLPYFYVIGMVTIFGLPWLLIWFWKRKMPLPARTLFWAAVRNLPPLLLVHDSGRGELTTIHERRGEGTVMTAQGKFKILPRYSIKIPFREMSKRLQEQKQSQQLPAVVSGDIVATEEGLQATSEQPDETAAQSQAAQSTASSKEDTSNVLTMKLLNENFIMNYDDFVVKRTNLMGMNLPFFIGYTGKLCLLNPEALALYEAGEMFVRTTPTEVLWKGKSYSLDDLPDEARDSFQPLLLMDPRKIQQIIYDGFDQSQIAAVVADSEELARLGQGISPRMKMILIIVVIVGLAAAALFLLPQMLGGQKQQTSQTTGLIYTLRSLLHI